MSKDDVLEYEIHSGFFYLDGYVEVIVLLLKLLELSFFPLLSCLMKNTSFERTPWGMVEPRYYKAPSKVVSIPVRFVGSERSRADSAIKIQRVLRGFLVRKTLKKIAAMRVELAQIESEIRVEVVKREPKERMRVIETIMNLLLKLDSVRVLHYSGLRECRKSVIRKAIALQEMLDQMGVADSDEGVKSEKKEEEWNCLVKEEEEEEEDSGMENLRNEEDDDEVEEIEGMRNEEVQDKESVLVKEEEGDRKKKELLMETMVEDNHKMIEMMAQLFQRNELQTSLLTSLSQRVEQLERVMASEKLRRKKKGKTCRKNKQTHLRNCFV
ncbi:golgin subfamily A member 6-like protein 6 [Vigna radiata var. radiata]|uniref:Golgin subfamily A member 6-like protein 6 n=1 Tax=Vigna radiata var. radiata TaxID=3916 RepID=A0A1S3TT31_VIGRR|nr:golgin subfamily A member 6-like protein 6 [Vigna radiata var. radiata]